MKKLFAFILALCMIFALCACGNTAKEDSAAAPSNSANENTAATATEEKPIELIMSIGTSQNLKMVPQSLKSWLKRLQRLYHL